MEIAVRRVFDNGHGSILLTLPRWWCRTQRIAPGQYVTLSQVGRQLRIERKREVKGR